MVTKIFSKLLSWHRENSKYYHFHFVIGYAVFLPFMLFVFIMSGNTGFVSWIIFVLNVCIGLNFWKDWRIECWQHEYEQFVKESFAHTVDMLEINSRNIRRLEDRLISVNRRRKSAERKLKKLCKLVSEKDAECKALNKHLHDYEAALLDAYLGYIGLYGKPCEDNRQRIMEYLRNNGPKLFQIVMTRQMVEDAYENLMFPDVPKSDADNLRCYDGFWSKLQAAEDAANRNMN